jgi:hypothetical protein
MSQNYLKGSEYVGWLIESALKAEKRSSTQYEQTFFSEFAGGLKNKIKVPLLPGNKRFIEQPLADALVASIAAVSRPDWSIKKSFRIPLTSEHLSQKEVDIAVSRGKRSYLIEQKTILNFNALGEVAFAGWCIKRGLQRKRSYRFVGLFNHVYGVARQKILALADEVTSEGIIHKYFVLFGDDGRYSSSALRALIGDIRTFLA